MLHCPEWIVAVVLVLIQPIVCQFSDMVHLHGHDGRESSGPATNEWIVKLTGESRDVADLLALKLGYENMGEIEGFPDLYLMRKSDHPVDDVEESNRQTRTLQEEVKVLFAQQLVAKKRVKREITEADYLEYLQQIVGDDDKIPINARSRKSRNEYYPRNSDPEMLALINDFQNAEKDYKERSENKSERSTGDFKDALWDQQWYMHSMPTVRSGGDVSTLNVIPVYESGITGKGIRVCVLDDGLEHTHDDLAANYDSEISYDFSSGGDPDPTPSSSSNSHGTRCAGEIAMIPNNNKCGAGIAYGAKVGGIRMLDGYITDKTEGQAIQFATDKVDIYSASWGPTDDGATVEGPGVMGQQALINGVTKGRGGLGSIYVWASGNGGAKGDNCNCDGYTSSIYTISVGSASQHNKSPWYAERCASTMAVTYSSGGSDEAKVATTSTGNGCTTHHTGTSAAAPLAAGMLALVLEANPKLGWRDVQHVVVATARKAPLQNEAGWKVNAAGYHFNHAFGFGLLDGNELVTAAKKYHTNIGKQIINTYKPSEKIDSEHVMEDTLHIAFKVDETDINYLEHVEIEGSIGYQVRGCLEIKVTSAKGTESQVLTKRDKDRSVSGFDKWKFMTVHFWGENPKGDWKLEIHDACGLQKDLSLGDIMLILYGSVDKPAITRVKEENTVRTSLKKQRTIPKVSEEISFKNKQQLAIDTNALEPDAGWSDLVGHNVLVRDEQELY